jgi:hypothetical protein
MTKRFKFKDSDNISNRMVQIISFFAFIAVSVGMLSTAALALPITTTTTASGYPGPTTTTQPGPSTVNQSLASGSAGSTIQASSCGFQAGATVTITVNGTSAGSGTVGSNGCISTPITVLSVNSTGGQVEVNGVKVTVNTTNNQLVVVGSGSNGAQLTVNSTFGLTTSSVSINSSTGKPFKGELLIAGILAVVGFMLAGILFVKRRSTTK